MVQKSCLSLYVAVSVLILKSGAASTVSDTYFLKTNHRDSDSIAVEPKTIFSSPDDPIYDPKGNKFYFEDEPETLMSLDACLETLEQRKRAEFLKNLYNFSFYNSDDDVIDAKEDTEEEEVEKLEEKCVDQFWDVTVKPFYPSYDNNNNPGFDFPNAAHVEQSENMDEFSPYMADSRNYNQPSPFEPIPLPAEEVFESDFSPFPQEGTPSPQSIGHFEYFSPAQLSPDSSDSLLVPSICKGYRRKWDFYLGGPLNLSEIFGWISRIGFANNLIHEFNFPISTASYTFLPHRFKNPIRTILNASNRLFYTERLTVPKKLFNDLYQISEITDVQCFKNIYAILLDFHDNQTVSIRIMVDPTSKNHLEKLLKKTNLVFGPFQKFIQ